MVSLLPYASEVFAFATKFGVTTQRRMAHFLAQCHHESGGFTRLTENLNYSASGLRTTFGSYFPNNTIAQQYANKPVAIANRVYANRLGNGSEASGEPHKYIGRGFIQITGKANYQAFKTYSGIDVVTYPDKAAEIKTALYIAFWYWNKMNINKYADANDIKKVSALVNRPASLTDGKYNLINGLTDRTTKTNYYLGADLSDFLKKKITKYFFWL